MILKWGGGKRKKKTKNLCYFTKYCSDTTDCFAYSKPWVHWRYCRKPSFHRNTRHNQILGEVNILDDLTKFYTEYTYWVMDQSFPKARIHFNNPQFCSFCLKERKKTDNSIRTIYCVRQDISGRKYFFIKCNVYLTFKQK